MFGDGKLMTGTLSISENANACQDTHAPITNDRRF